MSQELEQLDLAALVNRAENGDVEAQNELGNRYLAGEGVPRDPTEGARWFQAAADASYPGGLYNLGLLYLDGQGVDLDKLKADDLLRRAAEKFSRAAEHGDSFSQYQIGHMYHWGLGVRQDFKEAARWYREAACKNNAFAQFGLGQLLDNGDGVQQDLGQATEWYTKSGENGCNEGFREVGMMHLFGRGCVPDFSEARKWILMAAEKGNEEAINSLERLSYLEKQPPTDPRLLSISRILLLFPREMGRFWPWLPGEPNKFFLFAILDYQMPVGVVVENVRRFSEETFKDAKNLWQAVISQPESLWKTKTRWKEYNLHRYPAAHNRIWDIAKDLVSHYSGDARQIWMNQTPITVLERLRRIGKGKAGVGEQISRMIVGALIDTGMIQGAGDVKVDTHVKKVLGRAYKGRGFENAEAGEVLGITRKMYPPNPWLLDQPLYVLGQEMCYESAPNCEWCCLREACLYHESRR